MADDVARPYTEKELMTALGIYLRPAFHQMILDDTLDFSYRDNYYYVTDGEIADFVFRCEMGYWPSRGVKKVRSAEELKEMGFGLTPEYPPALTPEKRRELIHKIAELMEERKKQ